MMREQGSNTVIVDDYKRYELLRVGQWILILIILLLYTMIYLTSVVYDDFLRSKGCTNNTIRLPLIMLGEVDKVQLQNTINELFDPKICDLLKNYTEAEVQKHLEEHSDDRISSSTPADSESYKNNAKRSEPIEVEINRIDRKAPIYLEDKNCTETELFEKLGRCIKLELSGAALVYLGIFTMFLITTVDIISRVVEEPINKFPMTILLLLSAFFSLTNAYITATIKFAWFHPLLTSFAVLNLVLFGFFLTGFIKTFCGFCCPRKRNRR